MADCIHGMDERDCSTCKHGFDRPAPVTVEATFSARFDGDCPDCHLPIRVGQVIHKLSNDRYVHRGCE